MNAIAKQLPISTAVMLENCFYWVHLPLRVGPTSLTDSKNDKGVTNKKVSC